MEKSVEPTNREKTPIFNRILNVTAYPIAAISGLFVAATDLHNEAYEKLKKTRGPDPKNPGSFINPYFNDIENRYRDQYFDLAKEFESGAITKENRLLREIAIKRNHSGEIGAKMKQLGYSDEWGRMKDLGNKWSTVNRASKTKAIINGMTVAGISIGALLTIANSKSLIDYFVGDKESKDKTI